MNAALQYSDATPFAPNAAHEGDGQITQLAEASCHFGAARAIGLAGTNLVPADDQELAGRLSAILLPFSRGQIAQASCATKEAAKAWKSGRSMPQAGHLFPLARKIASVRKFVFDEIGPLCPMSASEVLSACVAQLQQLSHAPGQDGAEARAVLAALMGVI